MADYSPNTASPTDLPAWSALQAHQAEIADTDLASLFAADEIRFENFSLEAGDLFLDYSRNLLSKETRRLLLGLASESGVQQAVAAMFAGAEINTTEGRPALHVALRSRPEDGVATGIDGVDEIPAVLDAMASFASAVHAGEYRGVTGARFENVVNIGIGGSDLGPVMAARALRHEWLPGMQFHSLSNVDGTQLEALKTQVDPAKTLFVVCSKTFTTQETMANANAARAWLVSVLGEDAPAQHFAAASANHAAMDEFGVNRDYRFGFWDWVGGRYSIWSAIGLSLMLVIGVENFRLFLDGGRQMDRHFRTAPLEENMPVILALLAVWYNNFFAAASHAILPYDNRLDRFPAYLQQLQMESNGKSVRLDGSPVATQTGSVIWGEPGSNAQHSFYQLLHQGTRLVPADFILSREPSGAPAEMHELAVANCLAQGQALMDGYRDTDDPHRRHAGSRPSNTLLLARLDATNLGQLVALYEHKVYVESIIWGINAFDQFGVELGKVLANSLLEQPDENQPGSGQNPSTAGLLARLKKQ